MPQPGPWAKVADAAHLSYVADWTAEDAVAAVTLLSYAPTLAEVAHVAPMRETYRRDWCSGGKRRR